MISGWLLKVVIGIVAAGVIAVELGSPLIARAQADDAAHEVATEAAFQYDKAQDVKAMQAQCADTAAKKNVKLESCELNDRGEVAVTIRKQAFSLFLDQVGATKSWYDVKTSVTQKPPT